MPIGVNACADHGDLHLIQIGDRPNQGLVSFCRAWLATRGSRVARPFAPLVVVLVGPRTKVGHGVGAQLFLLWMASPRSCRTKLDDTSSWSRCGRLKGAG